MFLHLVDKSKKDAMDFCEEINATLPGMMELEYEGDFPRALFVAVKESESGAKKKYALIDGEGRITVKGFETVRRNVSAIAKETQFEVIRILLSENDPKKAFEHVRKTVQDIKDKRIDTELLAIPTRLTKNVDAYDSVGPHVAAAKRMKARGIDIFPGMIVRYVVTSGKGPIRDRAKLPEEVKKGEYDPDYYINNQVIPAVENIFQVFEYSTEELTGGKKQSKLGSYM
ncbi:hypothetical protein KY362_04065 [Candidatus Woesearchaeota archaeon]|nr:hypothetical protein [Candidatus Woesearchaeota archaeon]